MDTMENNVIIQVGIIVKDAAQTARHYADIFGLPVPPVIHMGTEAIANTQYHGQPTKATAKGAFFQMGPVQLEIIEPVGGPSTWEEFLRTKGEGIHHIAWRTTNMKDATAMLESKGVPLVQKGAWDGGRYAYLDSVAKLGAMMELLEFDGK